MAYSPLRVGAGSMLELWINVETPSAVTGNTILLDDSTKVSALSISQAYQWTKVQVPLDGMYIIHTYLHTACCCACAVLCSTERAFRSY